MTLAKDLAEGPPIAYRWMKDNLNRAQHGSLRSCLAEEAERQRWAAETEDFREATRAFVEGRSPRFRWVRRSVMPSSPRSRASDSRIARSDRPP